MLKKLGYLKNPLVDLEFYDKLLANRKFPLPQKKSKIIQNMVNKPFSKDELSQICSKNIQSVFSGMKSKNQVKNKNNIYPLNSYKYLKQKQKASLFVNKNSNNNINQAKTIKKISEKGLKVSPIDKNNKNIIYPPNIIGHNNNNNKRKKNLSVTWGDTKEYQGNSKKIKEIRIKANKKLSQVFTFNKNNKTNKSNIKNNGEEKIITISNLSNIEHNNDYDCNHKNKKLLEAPNVGIYSRKMLKSFKSLKSLSMEKRSCNTIQSIEINFGHSIYDNPFTDKKCFNYFEDSKIILIQRYFRKYMNNKKRKILEGISHLKKYMLNNLVESAKIIFLLYKTKLFERSDNVWRVKKEQYDMLKILKEKNILGMTSLKKYILKLIKSNKLELF